MQGDLLLLWYICNIKLPNAIVYFTFDYIKVLLVQMNDSPFKKKCEMCTVVEKHEDDLIRFIF